MAKWLIYLYLKLKVETVKEGPSGDKGGPSARRGLEFGFGYHFTY